MDADNIFKTIKELGHSRSQRDKLRLYCKSSSSQVLKYLPRRILNSDGADILDCLLNGFSENNLNCSNKVKIIDVILQVMRKEITSLTHCGDIMSRICLELPRLPIDELVRWCNDSVQSIVDDSDLNMIWRDIVPECINIISSQDKIKHCGSEMTGVEYKAQCVHTLCQCKWTERHLVQLASMFNDLQLSRNDHRQVVNKLLSYIIDMTPDALPPLVHQMLKLCKSYNVEVVLSHVSHYFSVRIYNKLEPPPQDSESTTMDIDDIVQYSPAELSRSLSTCLYHMSQSAEPQLMRRHVKLWPKTQLLRAPMLIDLVLAIANKGSDFRTVCLDTLRSAIELREMNGIRSRESAWVRSLLPPDVDVTNLLKVLTTESANHRQLTAVGLIDLALALLSVARARPTAPACWSHGKLVLARLCRSQPETASHVLAQLADRLAADATTRKQYTDCLYVLCKLTPVAVERCSQLSTILESCQPGQDDAAADTYRAVRPLVSFSTRVRDTLVMVCRKGLYSRDSAHRRLALSGFLTVLKHVKLAGGGCSQQSIGAGAGEQHSAHSYLTQLTVESHASQQGTAVTSRVRNETMCLEVVSILRRCLVQDAPVRQLLYTELYECTKEKVSLHESVLELLYEHLGEYLPEEAAGPPLLLDKCVQPTATGAVLLEPVGRLLYAVAQFLQPAGDAEFDDVFSSQAEGGVAHLRNKLLHIMDELSERTLFTAGDMEDLGLSDLTPESKAKALKVQQVIQCYEALAAHQLMQWTAESTHGNTLYKLYKDCQQLLDNTKVSPKGKKTKSFNETRETVKSQKSQKSQKEKGRAPVKMSDMVKARVGPFKQLPCPWDLRLCLRLLQLLYSEEVSWSSVEQRNVVRARSVVHVWALRCVRDCVRTAAADKAHATNVLYIAVLLHSRCLCRFQDLCDFDDNSALAALELYKTCLDVLLSQNYSLKPGSIFTNIIGLKESPVSASVAEILDKIHAALAQLEADEGEDKDVMVKKLVAALVQIATVVLEVPVVACDQLKVVIVKLEEYLRRSKQECLQLVPPLLTAAFREHRDVQLLEELLVKLTSALGLIDEEETSAEEETADFPAIDARSGHAVLGYVCAHIRVRARAVHHLLARARDLSSALGSATHQQHERIDKELKELYEGLVIQLCQLSRCVWSAARLRWGGAGAGGGAAAGEGPTGACVHLYSLLATFAKQVPPQMALTLRLERLLKLCGKKLSSASDGLITYAEASTKGRSIRLVPRLVLEAESFSRNVILLEKKAKLNYQRYLSLGTARDFRIKGPVLQEVLGAGDHETDRQGDNDDESITDAETDVLSAGSGDEGAVDRGHSGRKRRKVE